MSLTKIKKPVSDLAIADLVPALSENAGKVPVVNTTGDGFDFVDNPEAAWLLVAGAHNAQAYEKLCIDTSLAPVPLTFPAAPAVGASIRVLDAKGTFSTNNVTIDLQGEKIFGVVDSVILDVSGADLEFIYTGAAYGWTY